LRFQPPEKKRLEACLGLAHSERSCAVGSALAQGKWALPSSRGTASKPLAGASLLDRLVPSRFAEETLNETSIFERRKMFEKGKEVRVYAFVLSE